MSNCPAHCPLVFQGEEALHSGCFQILQKLGMAPQASGALESGQPMLLKGAEDQGHTQRPLLLSPAPG